MPWLPSMAVNGAELRTPPPPPRNEGLFISWPKIKGNQWLILSPDHKAGYFCLGLYIRGGQVDQPQKCAIGSKVAREWPSYPSIGNPYKGFI